MRLAFHRPLDGLAAGQPTKKGGTMSSHPRWTCDCGAKADRTSDITPDPRRASRAAQAARPRRRTKVARSAVAALAAPIAAALSLLAAGLGVARDTTGLSDSLSQEQRDWVRGLRAANGASCCDDADGIDPVWDIHDGHYRVHYGGQWLVVSPSALLTQPNRIGVARAWLVYGEGEVFVRCFLPGPTT
jgi:hypothetical protein